MSLQAHVTQAFYNRFGSAPAFVARAPGRVNLIGEHTDYNDGFVLPMAIDRAVWIALRPRVDGQVAVYSLDLDRTATFALDRLRHENGGWVEYLKGVAWALQQAGHGLAGWEGVMSGDVPRGAGLSSSAAIELATARAFQAVSDFPWDAAAMAKAGQRAENQWVGVNCGIMDQMISAAGQAGHALLIDCRSLDVAPAPLPPGTAVVILDTATRRGLVDSAYNERRAQCEAAAAFFAVPALRDVSAERFAAEAGGLDEVTRRRARHIVTENDRTLAAAAVMAQGDAAAFGRLMNASHASLRDDFEVSNHELNVMVQCAQAEPGCYGARMTGAGFGGCAVALVDAGQSGVFAANVAAAYRSRTRLTPAVYVCTASAGASIVA
jgi:galactokinase